MAKSTMISVTGVSRSFGKKCILDQVSLTLESSTIYGLVGLNGAGKTTFLRILMGLLQADSGSASVNGYDPWMHQEVFYAQSGIVLENDGFFGNLNILENLKIYASAKKIPWKSVKEYVDQFWAGTVITETSKKVKYLSRGQRMQCGLCRAFLGWPKVLFLDEPAVALDMTAYEHFKTIVLHAKQLGSSSIISSHQLETIDDLCDRVGNLEGGHLRELDIKQPAGQSEWLLRTDSANGIELIITESGGFKPSRNDLTWTFYADDAQRTIPCIVNKLVAAGYPVYEMRQSVSGFSSEIRKIYTGGDKNQNA
jgi:ABC-2 type transport system ATP-binding protein